MWRPRKEKPAPRDSEYFEKKLHIKTFKVEIEND